MFFVVLLLLTVVPLVELALLFWVADVTDWATTLWLVILTGVLGATLAKRQGLQVWQRIKDHTSQGKTPAGELLDGLMILFAGALLLTPGILTDGVGFLLLTPPVRTLLRGWLARRLAQRATVQIQSFTSSPFPHPYPGDANDIEAEYTVERDSEESQPAEGQDPRIPKSSE